jgi:hypothetical protein
MTNRMTARVMALTMALGAFASIDPASAQTAVGGPKKQIAVGGAAKQTSPVVPANKGVSTASSAPSKCSTGACAVKGTK